MTYDEIEFFIKQIRDSYAKVVVSDGSRRISTYSRQMIVTDDRSEASMTSASR